MKRFLTFVLPIMIVGCGALTNPDGTPMSREQIRAEIHDGLAAGSQVAKQAGEAGVPYGEIVAGGLAAIAALVGAPIYAAKTSGDRHAAVLKHVLAPGSVVPEKKVG